MGKGAIPAFQCKLRRKAYTRNCSADNPQPHCTRAERLRSACRLLKQRTERAQRAILRREYGKHLGHTRYQSSLVKRNRNGNEIPIEIDVIQFLPSARQRGCGHPIALVVNAAVQERYKFPAAYLRARWADPRPLGDAESIRRTAQITHRPRRPVEPCRLWQKMSNLPCTCGKCVRALLFSHGHRQ